MASWYGNRHDWGSDWTKVDGYANSDNDKIVIEFLMAGKYGSEDSFKLAFSPKEADELIELLTNCKEALDSE